MNEGRQYYFSGIFVLNLVNKKIDQDGQSLERSDLGAERQVVADASEISLHQILLVRRSRIIHRPEPSGS